MTTPDQERRVNDVVSIRLSNEIASGSVRRLVLITILGWFSMLGFDFLLHGGLLAKYYVQPSGFLLPPERALELIPLGYFSFFLLAVSLVWLMARLSIRGGRQGALFALKLGGLFTGAGVLGLMSISTVSLSLLLGWFLGETLQLTIAGFVVGSGLGGERLSRLLVKVVAFVVLSVIVTVVLQTLGFSPALRAR